MGAYLAALLLTLAIEVPIYTATLGPLTRLLGGSVPPWTRALVLGVAVNLASHPVAFLVVFPVLRHLIGSTAALIAVEVGVIVVEAWIIGRWLRDGTVALTASSLANVTSLTVGALFVI
jgi:hypothetical protein